MALPPAGLTCDQYYLYLASGYAYSPIHGVMYHRSQAVSERWIFAALGKHSFHQTEVAYWLSNRCYYDFWQRQWLRATFVKPPPFEARIWGEAAQSHTTSSHLQQKSDNVSNTLSSVNLRPKPTGPPDGAIETGAARRPKPSVCTTARARPAKDVHKREKHSLRKVQVTESKQKSRRAQAIKEKIQSVPQNQVGRQEFWNTVL